MRRSVLGFACAACAITVTLAGAAAKSAPPSEAALTAKMVAAYGGAAVLNSIKSQVTVVAFSLAGQPATLTTTELLPRSLLEVYEIPALHAKIIKGFDGTTAWSEDTYGNVKVLSGDQAQELQCEAIGADPAGVSSNRWPTEVKVLPSQTVDGSPYFVASVTPKGCPQSTAYINPKTYFVERLVSPAQTITFSDFKKGPSGEMYPATFVATGAQGTLLGSITSLKDNVAVDPSTFAVPPMPSPSPSAAAPTPPATPPAPAASPS